MFHGYRPNLPENEIQAIVIQKTKCELLIMLYSIKSITLHELLHRVMKEGFTQQKVINAIVKLQNEGWLMDDEFFNGKFSSMTDKLCPGIPSRRC